MFFDEEQNKELLEFIKKMDEDEKNGVKFVFGDSLKKGLVQRLVDRDYKITGFCVQGIFEGDKRPYKCWVEFSKTEDTDLPTKEASE